jgi:hypothetical protein
VQPGACALSMPPEPYQRMYHHRSQIVVDNEVWIPLPHGAAVNVNTEAFVIVDAGAFRSFTGQPTPRIEWSFVFFLQSDDVGPPVDIM